MKIKVGQAVAPARVPIGLAAAGSAFLAWAVRGRSSRVFGPSVWHGPRNRRALALTFDDGPSESTPAILEVLARYGVYATFFQLGANVDRLPQVAREVQDAGHEIGNHGYAHRLYCFRAGEYIARDIERAQDSIRQHAGFNPWLLRPPFGARWFGMRGAQCHAGLLSVMWTVIGYDWKRTADAVVRRVAARISPGAIVCLHDGRGLQAAPDIRVTVDAVRRLVPMLLDQGYRLETVSQLLCPTN